MGMSGTSKTFVGIGCLLFVLGFIVPIGLCFRDSLVVEGLFGKYRVLLAPMAACLDEAFRTLCREAGRRIWPSRRWSGQGASFANEKTPRHLLALADGEAQVAVQLFGHEPDTMAAQAAWIEREMGRDWPTSTSTWDVPPARSCRRGRLGAHEGSRRWPPPSCGP